MTTGRLIAQWHHTATVCSVLATAHFKGDWPPIKFHPFADLIPRPEPGPMSVEEWRLHWKGFEISNNINPKKE